MFELLPNHTQFPALLENLRKQDASLAQDANIAADGFNMAIKFAAQKMKDQYDKFFGAGSAKFSLITANVYKGGAIPPMQAWLAAAMAHAARVSAGHFQRSAEDQKKYMEGREAAGQVTAPGADTGLLPPLNFMPAPESGFSTKTLLIAGGAVAALLLLILILKK